MADGTKHFPIGGGAMVSDFTSMFSMARTRRTVFFVYGFMFAFVLFTVFLAFSPSNASSPWFTNIFATSTSSGSSPASDDSYGSQFSSFFSFWFPNSSQQEAQNFTFFPTPSLVTNSTRSNDTASGQKRKDPSGVKNETKIDAPTTNRTAIAPPKPLVSANQSATLLVTSPPAKKNDSEKVDKGVAAKSPSPGKSSSSTREKGSADTSSAEKSAASNLTVKPPPTEKSSSGKEDKSITQKGVVSNLPASLMKKPSNGTDSKQKTGDWLESLMNCNLFEGQWVKDESYPLYKPGSCSLIDEQFNCFLNGRPDKDYMKFKWKPKGCDLPR